MPINLRRVVAGGLAAGCAISLSAVAMVPVVGPQMDAALSARGVPPLSAVVAAFVWSVGYCPANVSNVMYGLMPVSLTVIGTLWGLVELVVAGEIGAYLYKDQ